nr:zinc finger MYM-type protein 6-like [Parasteatoda tepidariorum]
MLGEGSSNKIKPLSNNTVSRLIDEMAADVESKLIKFMREGKFELQIDDSTEIDNKAIVLAYVRFINENGAPAMPGRHTGLLAYLKKEVLVVITIHCQHFSAKKLSGVLHDTLQFVISGINKIIADSLNDQSLDLKYAKVIFKKYGYELAWVKLMDTYPQLWKQTEPLLISSLPSTNLVERGFSSVVQLLTKQRNRLDICFKGDLRINLTNIKPDIQALTEIHQAQGIHQALKW